MFQGGRQPNDGILINQLGYVSVEIDGEERFALLFDGINDIAVVPDSQTLRPRRAISIEALINPSPGARVIIGKQISIEDNTFNSYQLELDPFCFNLTDEFLALGSRRAAMRNHRPMSGTML